jgi:hypothetical protein
MTGQDLIAEMLDIAQRMDEAIADMRSEGLKAAEAERDYRKAKAKVMARLKAGGWAATATEAMANGDEVVAGHRYDRDYWDTMQSASKEALQVLKRRYDAARGIYEREQR